MSLAMTRKEREEFLADLHIGILGLAEPERGPLCAPLWYEYEPGGDIRFVTDRDSRKGKLIEKNQRLSFLVQSESMPYKYVSVEGPIQSVEAADTDRDLLPIAERYLGAEGARGYLAATAEEREGRDQIVVRMRPDRWLTVDYTKRFST